MSVSTVLGHVYWISIKYTDAVTFGIRQGQKNRSPLKEMGQSDVYWQRVPDSDEYYNMVKRECILVYLNFNNKTLLFLKREHDAMTLLNQR